MEFTIYSIGSAAYLEEILNAVAMISGTGDIEALAKIGMIIGVLILGFQAVMNGTGIQFQKMLVCAIMYLAMYGPTGRALIEDVYTGDVAVVDNVPLGPLAVGSIVSTIGYNITDTFETAFSVPGMTEYGFADPLDTLVKVRKVANNVQSLPSMTGTGNSSLLASWANYLRECTLTATNSNPVALRDVMTKPDAIGAIRFDSNVYYTKIYDGSANGVTLSCRDAYTALRGTTDTAQDAILEDVAKSFAKPGSLLDSTALESRLNNALFALTGAATDARNYTVTAVLLPILEGAPGQRAIEDMQGAAAIMMGQAMQQQNTQWAAEGSMFTKYIRPFMTFFEGFIYAITPLMAFVIVLGGFGIGLVSKYLLILIWMMLWMPVLSIVNLYTISTTKAKIESVLGTSTFVTDGISFQQMRDMMPIIETQIGVAGMMASATPALCMFLVYGTSVAASGIASRLNGSDTINEKIASPDVLQPGAGMSMSAQTSHDPTRGARQTGADEMVSNLVTGSQLSSTVQSMSSVAKGAQQQFSQQLSSGVQETYGDTISYQDAAKIGEAIRASAANGSNSSLSSTLKNLDASTGSAEESNAILGAASVGGNASLKLGAKSKGGGDGKSDSASDVGAGIGGDSKFTTQDSSVVKDGKSNQLSDDKSAALVKSTQAALSKDNSFSLDKVFADNQSLSKMFTNSDTLSKSATDSVTATEQYQNAEAAMQSYGLNTNMSALALAGNLAKGDGLAKMQNMLQYTSDSNGNSLWDRMQNDVKTLNQAMPYQSAMVAAGLKALSETGNLDNFFGSGINAGRNSGIEGPNNGDLEGQFGARHSANASMMSANEAALTDGRASAQLTGEEGVNEKFFEATGDVAHDQVYNKADVGDAAVRSAKADLAMIGSEQKDIAPFATFSAMGTMLGHYSRAGMTAEEKAQEKEMNIQTGLDNGLTQYQASYYALAKQGDVETAEMAAFESHMVDQEGFTPFEARGARLKIEEAATSANDPSAQLSRVGQANSSNYLKLTD
ncbi:conjugal transfer protein TraG N-terminal domain-containing protein [Pseudomonas aeruginosa]|uniref:conjugal transfer protein TraG N-terminal domain-containing protein n=1 Tax=Pseudomonas aeruginosa TaxID=287 RepID=UPI001C3F7094|nr:conjugal transfer protein TraG N-terminal domain-containing protein [Pseudomonas aeruginosa]